MSVAVILFLFSFCGPKLIHYRSFRNSDPPALAEIWRSQPPERGLMQPMSADVFEHLVLAKPYFDNTGLIVAVNGETPIGFAHAAFGPTDNEQGLSKQLGVTCLVMVHTQYHRQGIGAELLARSEEYLRNSGAQVLYGGGIRPLNPFYIGLMGGSELPGVLDSQPAAQHLFLSNGYTEIDRTLVWQRDLAGFRAPVDRQQMQIRRKTTLQVVPDPTPESWWCACTEGGFDRTRFELHSRDEPGVMASAVAWMLEPLASSWGVNAAGLVGVGVNPRLQRQGVGTFLLSEILRHLQTLSVTMVEVQTMQQNTPAQALYKKLGFKVIDQGAIYRKQ